MDTLKLHSNIVFISLYLNCYTIFINSVPMPDEVVHR